MYIDSSRVVDSGLDLFPTDIWLAIFRQIPPQDRVKEMLKFGGRFPGLAFIFNQEPSLWMSWTLCQGTFLEQALETRFSMNYWVRLYRSGRQVQVEVHSSKKAIDISLLVDLIPSQALPFIYSLHLNVPFISYVMYGFRTLLDELSSLKHLKLVVQSYVTFNPGPIHRRRSFTDHRPLAPGDSAIRSLSLNNLAIFPDSLTTERWLHITRIHLAFGIRRALPQNTSLYDIMYSAPNLAELSAQVAYALRRDSFSGTFFSAPRDKRYLDWHPALTFIDVRGGQEHVSSFVSSIIDHPRSKVHSVNVDFNHDEDEQPNLFAELESFIGILGYQAVHVLVDLDLFNLVVKMVDGKTSVRNWDLSWRLFSWPDDSWVCHSPFDMFCNFTDWMQPEDRFLNQQNKFRLFVSSIMLKTHPSIIEVSADRLAVSLFAMMNEPCLVDTLHLTGQMVMYETLLHYILQHSDMFPRLTLIYLHHRSWTEDYTPRSIAKAVTQFNPPLSQVNSTRKIVITIGTTDIRRSSASVTKVRVDWSLFAPSESSISDV